MKTLKEIVSNLRADLTEAILERNELQELYLFSEDQLKTMKVNIKDLECSILREKELNANSRKLNAEYLVNILRSFLMTKDGTEHAKLVPVLCSILHFRAEDTIAISEKWCPKANRGFIGWMLPAAGSSSAFASNENQSNQNYNSIYGLDMYA